MGFFQAQILCSLADCTDRLYSSAPPQSFTFFKQKSPSCTSAKTCSRPAECHGAHGQTRFFFFLQKVTLSQEKGKIRLSKADLFYPIYNSITLMFKSISNQPGPTAEGNHLDNSSSVFMQVLDAESGTLLITSLYI